MAMIRGRMRLQDGRMQDCRKGRVKALDLAFLQSCPPAILQFDAECNMRVVRFLRWAIVVVALLGRWRSSRGRTCTACRSSSAPRRCRARRAASPTSTRRAISEREITIPTRARPDARAALRAVGLAHARGAADVGTPRLRHRRAAARAARAAARRAATSPSSRPTSRSCRASRSRRRSPTRSRTPAAGSPPTRRSRPITRRR